MSGEVHVEGVVPSGLVGVLPGNAGVRTGVVHQDVDGSDLGPDETGHGLDGVWIGQVGVHRDPGAARALEGGEEGVGVGVLAEVVDRHGCSGGRERPPDLGADAGGPAGDEGGAALERPGLERSLKQGQGHCCSVRRGGGEGPVWW